MKYKYLVIDIEGDKELFETLKEAQDYAEGCFFNDGAYHPDIKDTCIFELIQTVDYDVIDKRSNYKCQNVDDVPEGGNLDDAWQHDCEFDEIWKHKFVDVETGDRRRIKELEHDCQSLAEQIVNDVPI